MNQKVYIGQTRKGIRGRYGNRLEKHNSRMQPDIDKYGSDNFIIEEIDSCDLNWEADRLERWYIKFYHSSDKRYGYNITVNGSGMGMTNKNHSDEAKQKNREKHLNKKHSKETKQYLSELTKKSWKTGKLKPHDSWAKGLTKETNNSIKKWSDSLTGRVIPEEQRVKTGKTLHETRSKLTEEERSKLFGWSKGLTKETNLVLKQKSEKVKKTFEEKKLKGEKIGRPKGIPMTPEQIAKREETKRLKRKLIQ